MRRYTFLTSIRLCFARYAKYTGLRAPRAEYLYWVLFCVISYNMAHALDDMLNDGGVVRRVVGFALFLPTGAVTIRRLHDGGNSGFWAFLVTIPLIGWFLLLIFTLQPGVRGPNRFGPDPLDASSATNSTAPGPRASITERLASETV